MVSRAWSDEGEWHRYSSYRASSQITTTAHRIITVMRATAVGSSPAIFATAKFGVEPVTMSAGGHRGR